MGYFTNIAAIYDTTAGDFIQVRPKIYSSTASKWVSTKPYVWNGTSWIAAGSLGTLAIPYITAEGTTATFDNSNNVILVPMDEVPATVSR